MKTGKTTQKRDALKTQEKLLQAATTEFSKYGFEGARVDRIVKQADCNIRMAYHYFQGKKGLYQATLEKTYAGLREEERGLLLANLPPVNAIEKLVLFTFDYMASHPEFISLVVNENRMGAMTLYNSSLTIEGARPLVAMIENILSKGEIERSIRPGLNAKDLYLTILSLSVTHITQRQTLSLLFQEDLSSGGWMERRRGEVLDIVMRYVKA